MSVTPSAEVVGLRFVERLGSGALLGLAAWLCLGGARYGQLFWLGMPLSTSFAHDLDHQHVAHLLAWGDAKSPA